MYDVIYHIKTISLMSTTITQDLQIKFDPFYKILNKNEHLIPMINSNKLKITIELQKIFLCGNKIIGENEKHFYKDEDCIPVEYTLENSQLVFNTYNTTNEELNTYNSQKEQFKKIINERKIIISEEIIKVKKIINIVDNIYFDFSKNDKIKKIIELLKKLDKLENKHINVNYSYFKNKNSFLKKIDNINQILKGYVNGVIINISQNEIINILKNFDVENTMSNKIENFFTKEINKCKSRIKELLNEENIKNEIKNICVSHIKTTNLMKHHQRAKENNTSTTIFNKILEHNSSYLKNYIHKMHTKEYINKDLYIFINFVLNYHEIDSMYKKIIFDNTIFLYVLRELNIYKEYLLNATYNLNKYPERIAVEGMSHINILSKKIHISDGDNLGAIYQYFDECYMINAYDLCGYIYKDNKLFNSIGIVVAKIKKDRHNSNKDEYIWMFTDSEHVDPYEIKNKMELVGEKYINFVLGN